MKELNNVRKSNSAKKTEEEVLRTVKYWRKRFPRGIDKQIFSMVVFEQGLEERDRLTKSQLDFFINRRKNKRTN